MGKVSDTGFAARQKNYDNLVKKVEEGKILTATEVTAMQRFEQELSDRGEDLPDVFTVPDQVAEYSGYKVRTIYTAVKKGELVRLSDGCFERSEVDRWMQTKNRLPVIKGATDPDSGDDEEKKGTAAYEERRFRKARADREEMLVAQMRGELVEKAEAERQWTNRVHEFRTALLLFSRRTGHKIASEAGVDSKVVTRIMDEEARQLLKSLSRKVVLHVD